jgi:serine/threonine protein kinase
VDKRYKITDFGSHQGGTVGDDFIGTILYMPPELLDQKSYSRRLDVWSLGVSLFETYFKIHPFFYL